MRATGDKLEENYIIPIARELAVGLHAIHEAGIIHRDVKGNLTPCAVSARLSR
jgi:serine/threonine protein kinase